MSFKKDSPKRTHKTIVKHGDSPDVVTDYHLQHKMAFFIQTRGLDDPTNRTFLTGQKDKVGKLTEIFRRHLKYGMTPPSDKLLPVGWAVSGRYFERFFFRSYVKFSFGTLDLPVAQLLAEQEAAYR